MICAIKPKWPKKERSQKLSLYFGLSEIELTKLESFLHQNFSIEKTNELRNPTPQNRIQISKELFFLE